MNFTSRRNHLLGRDRVVGGRQGDLAAAQALDVRDGAPTDLDEGALEQVRAPCPFAVLERKRRCATSWSAWSSMTRIADG